MKLKTFSIAGVLAIAVFLFAQRPAPAPPHPLFAGVVDLTHTVSEKAPNWEGTAKSPYEVRQLGSYEKAGYFSRSISLPEHFATHVDAPAHFARGAWTVDQIPASRLVASLVVIDVHQRSAANPDYQVSMDDLAAWEQAHGQVPPAAVVMARTGWSSRWYSMRDYRNPDAKDVTHYPGFALDTVKFLVDGRQVSGLGIDTMSVDYGASSDFPVHRFTAQRNVYHVENVANLEVVPESGAVVVVAPAKLKGGSGGPVRVLALVK